MDACHGGLPEIRGGAADEQLKDVTVFGSRIWQPPGQYSYASRLLTQVFAS